MRINKHGHLIYNSVQDIVLCKIFKSHKYRIVKPLSCSSTKIYCTVCEKEFVINHDIKVTLDWDSDFESFYKDIL